MNRTSTAIRAAAFALSVVIATSLFATIVAVMPPDFSGAHATARAAGHTEVAIVPSRIEVIGLRSDVTAENDVVRARGPRS
jgi:hypothetical protein